MVYVSFARLNSPKIFLRIVSLLLILTAFTKIEAIFSNKIILHAYDPILGVQMRFVFAAAGALELFLACVCLLDFVRRQTKCVMLIWLCGILGAYRLSFGLLFGLNDICPCLGNLPSALNLTPFIANLLTVGMLLYIGGGACWFYSQEQSIRKDMA
jgi:hypothetical protein